MRRCRSGTRRAAASLDDDHRLKPCCSPGSRHELTSLTDSLNEEKNTADIGIGCQVVEHVAEVDVAHVSQ